jgi:GT2 family glycosyltransferase
MCRVNGAICPAEVSLADKQPQSQAERTRANKPSSRISNVTTDQSTYVLEGHIDFHGHHSAAAGWFVGGWISHPWPSTHRPQKVGAILADRSLINCTHIMFYERRDLRGRGIGFAAFFHAVSSPTASLVAILVESAGQPYTLYPGPGASPHDAAGLTKLLQEILGDGSEAGSAERQMHRILSGNRAADPITGVIDFYGFSEAAGGWLYSGWISRPWPADDAPTAFKVSFDGGRLEGDGIAVLYQRHDLAPPATGLAFIVSGQDRPDEHLTAVRFEVGGLPSMLNAASSTARFGESKLLAQFRRVLDASPAGPRRDSLHMLVKNRPYSEEAHFGARQAAGFLEIDEAMLCGPTGLLLSGWCVTARSEDHTLRVQCGSRVTQLDLARCLRIDRPDVIGAVGLDDTDSRCGFIGWLPDVARASENLLIELETSDGFKVHRTVAPSKAKGIPAIKRLLGLVDVRYDEVVFAFEHVLGPAVAALNEVRLSARPGFEVIDYGTAPKKPRFSVIVPVHGRLDFIEYQLALFSADPAHATVEFIYVVDDPPKRQEAQRLFPSSFGRFRVPFRAVFLDQNVGYAPANNIGLGLARAPLVAFLNSDVFPETPDWLGRLARRRAAGRNIGVIGPVLLFEDGSVQHRGMAFVRQPEFGGFHFSKHLGKGRRPPTDTAPQTHASITGACLLMTRALANDIGGFDEGYVLGDFEDSDLCLKVRQLGYRCVVDPEVQLFHLERKSQAGSDQRWRMNLTLYNAWRHEARWGQVIAAERRSQ